MLPYYILGLREVLNFNFIICSFKEFFLLWLGGQGGPRGSQDKFRGGRGKPGPPLFQMITV